MNLGEASAAELSSAGPGELAEPSSPCFTKLSLAKLGLLHQAIRCKHLIAMKQFGFIAELGEASWL
jgi:hypothetical protein